MRKNIPVNIVTGFLGAGKTTSILGLLAARPADETWAILVNEFGEVGIDKALINGELGDVDDVVILEVPGGCMCCTAGLSMNMTLSQIIFLVQPDRILIEPTGLGHPEEVMQNLHQKSFSEHLLIQRTLTLVDPRSIEQSHVAQHPSFLQQIDMADIVIASKPDLCSTEQLDALEEFVKERRGAQVAVTAVSFGQLSIDSLEAPTLWRPSGELKSTPTTASSPSPLEVEEKPLPETGVLVATNAGDGFKTIGWRISADKHFNYGRLMSFFNSLAVERMKAVTITDAGVFAYNLSGGILKEIAIDDCLESRIEIICQEISEQWESGVMDCLGSK